MIEMAYRKAFISVSSIFFLENQNILGIILAPFLNQGFGSWGGPHSYINVDPHISVKS